MAGPGEPNFDNWISVGVRQNGGMVVIRKQEGDEFQDYYVPPDPANSDYQQFLTWKGQGNEPKILFEGV